MNLSLYDFDKTIYNGDTGLELLKFLFKYYPSKSYKYIPHLLKTLFRFIFKLDDKDLFKQHLFSLFSEYNTDEWDELIIKFWEQEKKKFFPQVLKQIQLDKQKGFTIGIISASCEIMLYPIMQLIPADFIIGTLFEIKDNRITSHMIGKNCKNKEKVSRLHKYMKENYPNQQYKIINMYSDSLHDLPLLEAAENAFTVNSTGAITTGFPAPNQNF